MLFHSSLRTELARSFGATLVVLLTIVLTMLLIRTLGLASKGSVNPEEIMLVLGYTVLGYTQTILTLALFIAIVSTLARMYRDSEMIIWFSSGRRVFFIDKDTADGTEGRNVFISSIEKNGTETVTTANSGRIEQIGDQSYLMLRNGQRLEAEVQTPTNPGRIKVSEFEEYGALIGATTPRTRSSQALKARSTWSLMTEIG